MEKVKGEAIDRGKKRSIEARKKGDLFSPPNQGLRELLCPLPGAQSGREAAFAATERREVTAAGAAATAERRVAAIVLFVEEEER